MDLAIYMTLAGLLVMFLSTFIMKCTRRNCLRLVNDWGVRGIATGAVIFIVGIVLLFKSAQ